MTVLDHARKRVTAVIEEIERLRHSEFPYDHPRIALELLENKFNDLQKILGKVSPTAPSNIILDACKTSFEQLFTYVPFLGFILRSTNVRNAFEAYHPLLRLTRSILGPDSKLIVSSEWDYSPHVYPSICDLPGFVLIGLPAPESANPLLLPLAGHELGHSVWDSQHLSSKYESKIQTLIIEEITQKRWSEYATIYPGLKKEHFLNYDIFASPIWVTAYTWALLQSEEIFCDFFGIRLFQEAYLRAFEFLLSPGFGGVRPVSYPNISRRVSHLVDAANEMDTKIDPNFTACFIAESEPSDPTTKLIVSTADAVSISLVPELIKMAQEIALSKAIPQRDSGRVSEICNGFNRIIPTAKSYFLSDILNAGWMCYLDSGLWENIPQIQNADRDRVLKDLMLKSIEVSEAYERLKVVS